MKMLIKFIVTAALFVAFGTSVQAGAERHKFIKKQRKMYTPAGKQGRGIASTPAKRSKKKRSRRYRARQSRFKTPLTLRFESKKYLKMVPTEQRIYLKQYVHVAMAMEAMQNPNSAELDQRHFERKFWNRFLLEEANAGTLINYGCVKDSSSVNNNGSFDTNDCFTKIPNDVKYEPDSTFKGDDGKKNPYVPSCRSGSGPCALFYGVSTDGKAFCGTNNSSASCEVAREKYNEESKNEIIKEGARKGEKVGERVAQKNLQALLGHCAQQDEDPKIDISKGRCGLLINDFNQYGKRASQHCETHKNTGPCQSVKRVLADINKNDPYNFVQATQGSVLAEAPADASAPASTGEQSAFSCNAAGYEAGLRDRENKSRGGTQSELDLLINRTYSFSNQNRADVEARLNKREYTEEKLSRLMLTNAKRLLREMEAKVESDLRRNGNPRTGGGYGFGPAVSKRLNPKGSEYLEKRKRLLSEIRARFEIVEQEQKRDLNIATKRWKTTIETARQACFKKPKPPTTLLLERYGACKRPVPAGISDDLTPSEWDVVNDFRKGKFDDPDDPPSANQIRIFKEASGLTPNEFKSWFCASKTTEDFYKKVSASGKFFGYVKPEDRKPGEYGKGKPDSYPSTRAPEKIKGLEGQLYVERCVEESIDKFKENHDAVSLQEEAGCAVAPATAMNILNDVNTGNHPFMITKRNPSKKDAPCYVVQSTEDVYGGKRLHLLPLPVEWEKDGPRTIKIKYADPKEFENTWISKTYKCENDDVMEEGTKTTRGIVF